MIDCFSGQALGLQLGSKTILYKVSDHMVGTTAVKRHNPTDGRLRPLDPARDLGTIADLIAQAFSDELDRQGQAAIRELRWMARLSPLVWWWAQADPSFRETYNGFVWEEPAEGRGRPVVVGNANLSRSPGSRHHWVIANVVVRPDQRRRGIARQLLEATITEARQQEAEGVVLQVYRDNWPALHLYTDLGFQEVAGETELEARSIPPAAVVDTLGYRIRPWRPADGQVGYELAIQAIHPAQQWLRPVRPGDYQLDWIARAGQRLAEVLGGRRIVRLVAEADGVPPSEMAAVLTVDMAVRDDTHRLSLLIKPRHRGQVEEALVGHALTMLAVAPPRPVLIKVPLDHVAAIRVLGDHGFRERRTLLTLSYPLGRERRQVDGEYW